MSHSMGGYDDPYGREPVTDSVEDALLYGREPTDRELSAMNAERSETAHERDRETYDVFTDRVVQVRIAGATARRTYAYEVPRGTDANLGDWVTLPGNVVNEHGGFGVVKGFGRDGYKGPLKAITGVIPEPDELMIKMSVVKTKDAAAKIYDQAVAEGWTGGDLLELIEVGESRLKARGVR